ncbi:MAG: PEGA domain-containing protein, partial [Victivallales bacterium]|nr:PEGA domain-containing protein [Victivallales bacterium]
MKLRAMNGQQSGTEYQMNGMSFTIGREEGNDIIIPESSVSRRHCRFLKNGESWTVEDLQSLNGVYVNGMKIKVPTEVFKGDTIRIHESDFRVEEGPERPASMPVAGAPASKGNGHGCAIVIIFLLMLFIICIAVGGVIAKQRGAAEAPPEAEVSATGTTQADDTLLPDNALDDLKAEAPATQAPPPKQESVAAEAPAVADSVEPVAEKPSRRARLNADLPLVVYSNPEGATIYIDKKHYGTTPAVIKELSAGKHTLELSMQGYELFRTQVETPEPVPAKPYRLILKPGVVQINTEPSGAWVWEGRLLKGVTPLIIEDFAEGEHELDIRGPGCERHVESVKVNKAKGSEVNIALKSMLGGIEVTSQPAGCSVYLNGLYLGVTSEASPLAANGILEGRYVVKVEHPSGIYSNAQVAVKRGETARHEAKIWLPTHKLVLNDGREFYGKLADES